MKELRLRSGEGFQEEEEFQAKVASFFQGKDTYQPDQLHIKVGTVPVISMYRTCTYIGTVPYPF